MKDTIRLTVYQSNGEVHPTYWFKNVGYKFSRRTPPLQLTLYPEVNGVVTDIYHLSANPASLMLGTKYCSLDAVINLW